ncbi:hypothetical protein BS47DRAFT_1371407 [Hydnum rufescens UP504]|uniref:AAA+ ATPase domain-containing protein n=1 Tax=Hydnum rufescens UP504 TaxID=1448309 RepID=A0A9P6B4D9_9AGAM|nr:hypothetical protein BS47DRAFT_1371407 [Hydnum rufescens UP504]
MAKYSRPPHFPSVLAGDLYSARPATCINQIVESSHGRNALQAAMRHDIKSSFLNGLATELLQYLFRAADLGDVLDHLLTAIVDPPIFWTAFNQAFDQGQLNEQAQEAFATLLFRLINLSVASAASYLDGPGGRHDNDFVDFRQISILPTAHEILCKRAPFLRPSGVMEDPDAEETREADYLDNTFRLLREDMIYEMREELQIALSKTGRRHRGLVIEDVTYEGVYTGTADRKTRWGIQVKCQGDFKSMKGVAENKREYYLEKISPSLVCILSGDQIIGFASVNRVLELLAENPPVIVLQLEGKADHLQTFSSTYNRCCHLCVRTSVEGFAEHTVHTAVGGAPVWKDGALPGSASVTATPLIRALAMNPSLNLQGPLQISNPIVLDKSQAASLLAGLTQKVSLIQGPPVYFLTSRRTGKSFIGALLAKAIYEYTNQKIVVIGIPDASIARLGGRANTQNGRFTRSKAEWAIIDELKNASAFIVIALEKAMERFSASKIDFKDILVHIEFEDSDYFDAFFRFDAGQFKNEPNVRTAAKIWNMPRMPATTRWSNWKSQIRKDILDEISTIKSPAKFGEAMVATLREKRIIGCTTTGAAKFTREIRAAHPDILLVEEAGEILESHVLTAMGKTTSQMILIGDHKQLRPKVKNYKLTVEKGDGFELNRSLFERLVLKGFPHETLTTQHRMRPEISAFIRSLTYPDLTDAAKTQGRDNIRGIQNNIIFIDHHHPEDNEARISDHGDGGSTSSKQNSYEAEMVWKIVRYLAQQGYGTENLVVLTPYLGQLATLRHLLKQDNDPVLNDLDSHDLIRAGFMSPADHKPNGGIRLSTIDNYQGEESHIVIASLTRSNNSGDIGFMSSPERLNVLISRARDGFIVIGNSETFIKAKKGKELWGKFFALIKQGSYMYEGFPIKCERHPDRAALIKSASEFETHCPDGGCTEPCNTMLNCGIHPCPLKCHQTSDHPQMSCPHPYSGRCDAGRHTVNWKCHESKPDPCPSCAKEAAREEKRKRELELKQRQEEEEELKRQADREEEKLKHDLRMADLDAQLKVQEDAVAHAQLLQERANLLGRRMKDVEAAKANAQKATANARAHANAATSSASTSQPANPAPAAPNLQPDTPSTNPDPRSNVKNSPAPSSTNPSNARSPPNPQTSQGGTPSAALSQAALASPAFQDWLEQKQNSGEKNDAIDNLMGLTGLEEVKEQVLSIKAHIDLMKRQGVPVNKERLNLVLLGNPGTGKTTVARLYAQFLESIKVLPGDAFIETTGSSLAHEGVGGAQKLISDAMKVGGGAIFIDEAYQLVSAHQSSGGQVLDFLLAEMENRVGDLVFILAGYTKQMEKFFEHNPGLQSRILTMLEALVEKRYSGQMKIEDGVRGLYARIAVRRLGRGRGREGFGNARALQNMFARIGQRQAQRLKKERKEGRISDDFMIQKEDFIGPDPSQVLPKCAAWERLQKLIGLDSVKEAVRNFFDLVDTNYHRELQEKEPLAMSLNRLYGQVLVDLGLLSNGEVVVKNPSDFVGAYLGHSEKNTKAILDSTVGKVLVIDENSGHQDSFKTTVIDTIVAEIQSVPGEDRCVLLLGYKEQMEEMFQNVNPGLARRFAIENAFTFEDFTESQLRKILDFKLKDQDLGATDLAKQVAGDLLDRVKNRPNFGNAGEVENMLGLAKTRYQKRLASVAADQRSEVIFEPQDFDPDWERDRNAPANLAKLFEDLVGCDDIVRKLGDYQKIARTMKASGVDMRKQIPTSFIFKGPPGTGKTTIARKFGQVYYDMGFLSSPDLIECSASDLVGQYVGHTGPKTKKLFEKALGKVLFVDEAYRLSQGHFAQEAIDEVVGLMTNERFMNKMVIIFAGYEKEMNSLLGVNPGLASRLSEEIILNNMPPAKCLQVLDKELRKMRIILSELADTSSSSYSEMESIVERMSRLSNWGNARDIKAIAQKFIHHAFGGADEAIVIMQDALNQQRQRLGVPRMAAVPPPSTLPMASSSNSAPPPPPSKTGSSSATNGSQLPKPPGHNNPSSNQSPPKPPRPPTPAASKPPTKPPSHNSGSSSKTWRKSLPLPPSITSPVLALLQQSQNSTSSTPDRHGKGKQSPAQSTTGHQAVVRRDPGVKDGVWKQLQLDKSRAQATRCELSKAADRQKAAEAELEARDLALKRARDQVEQEELERKREAARIRVEREVAERARVAAEFKRIRLEQETKRREEEDMQRKLRNLGVCSQGFPWIKQVYGYRCEGGGHFILDSQLR